MAGNSPITSGSHEIMNEQSEIPQKEQYVMSPELAKAIHGAKERVQTEAKQPQQDILERTSGMGFVSAIKEATKPHLKQIGSSYFKDFKASVMAAISLLPMVSTGASAARAAETAVRADSTAVKLTTKADELARVVNMSMGAEVAVADKVVAQAAQAGVKAKEAVAKMGGAYARLESKLTAPQFIKFNELVKNGLDARRAAKAVLLPAKQFDLFEKEVKAGVNMAHAFEHASKGIDYTKIWKPFEGKKFLGKMEVPTGKLKFGARIGAERVAEGWFHELLHTLDPYPDVPGLVSLVGFLDLIPGVVGAELVPAAWQMITDNVQRVKAEIGMAKDVSKVVLSRMGVKFDKLKEPKVARAAEMFLPSTATATA